MISIEHSDIGNLFKINNLTGIFNAEIIEKPFYDPNKKIAQT